MLLGLTLAEAREVLPEIIEFSELGQFIDQPMRTYSSGMFFRLGFSVAVHVKPEILLIDEVLAVGDAQFQDKCMTHIHGLRDGGVTLVLVTHDMLNLPKFCDRGVLLEQGRITDEGSPHADRAQLPCAGRGAARAQAGGPAAPEARAGGGAMMVRLDFTGRAKRAARAIRVGPAALPGVAMISECSPRLPFKDASVDEMFVDDAIARRGDIAETLDELWRVSKPGALIHLRLPHASSSLAASRDPRPKPLLTLDTFNYYDPRSKPWDAHSPATFTVERAQLRVAAGRGRWRRRAWRSRAGRSRSSSRGWRTAAAARSIASSAGSRRSSAGSRSSRWCWAS